MSEGLLHGMGKVKGASNVLGLSNWKNGVPAIEKTSGGTGERVGHVMFGMPIHPQSEDFKVGSWLHRLEVGVHVLGWRHIVESYNHINGI